MKITKKTIDCIEKCYAVASFEYNKEHYLLCSAEGNGPCRAYDLQGNLIETLWNGPGGVMTLQQFPNASCPVLLATQGFYSPDNAAQARLVYYYRKQGEWHCEILCDMPFLHRFGIVGNKEKKYLIAATLKSASAYEGDWSSPGSVWAAELPEDIFQYNQEHPLEFQPIIRRLYKNHGFSINKEQGESYGVVGTDNGVYVVYPPKTHRDDWKYERILEEPVSDMLYRDFDDDGQKELLVISPFHGETIKIFKKDSNNQFKKVYEREKNMPFAHAIWGGRIRGREYAFVGGRGGEKELISLYYHKEKQQYVENLIDKGAGAANCMLFQSQGQVKLLSANRETDEVAIYSLPL